MNFHSKKKKKKKNREVLKITCTLMAQSLPEIWKLPNLGVKMDKNVYKNREGWYL